MGKVLLLSVEPETSAMLRNGARRFPDIDFEDVGRVERAQFERPMPEVEAMVLGSSVAEPVRLAQQVRALNRDVEIMILGDPDHFDGIRKELLFSPFVGQSVTCRSTDDRDALSATLLDAVDRSRKRRRFRSTLPTVQKKVEGLQAPAPHGTQFLHRLLTALPVGVVETNRDQEILTWNDWAGDILARGRMLEVSRFRELFPDSERTRVDELVERCGKGAQTAPWLFRCEGDQFLELTATALDDEMEGGALLFLIQDVTTRIAADRERARLREEAAAANALAAHAHELEVLNSELEREVDERRQVEAALREAKEQAESASHAKSDFLANMSHELRTPLNSVIGFTRLLLKNRRQNLVAEDLDFLSRIHRNGLYLLQQIDDLLDIVRIEQGRLDVVLQPLDIAELMREASAQFEPIAKEKGLLLEVTVPDGLDPIQADPQRMRQVVTNLLSNAMKFTERGRVNLRVLSDGGTPRAIEVEDTGIGVKDNMRSKIFERFVRVEDAESTPYPGTGLGLAICRSLCQEMGFDIEMTSKTGDGSKFTVTLTAG